MAMLVRTTYASYGKTARQNFNSDTQLMQFNRLVSEARNNRAMVEMPNISILVSTGFGGSPVVLTVRGHGFETKLASDGELSGSEAEAAIQKFCQVNLTAKARRDINYALIFNDGAGSISSGSQPQAQERVTSFSQPQPSRTEVHVHRAPSSSADGAAFIGALLGSALANAFKK